MLGSGGWHGASYLGDVLHGGIERVPFCRVNNNKTLPKVAEELPGQGQGWLC